MVTHLGFKPLRLLIYLVLADEALTCNTDAIAVQFVAVSTVQRENALMRVQTMVGMLFMLLVASIPASCAHALAPIILISSNAWGRRAVLSGPPAAGDD